jgi:double-strand break repair protein MRE11
MCSSSSSLAHVHENLMPVLSQVDYSGFSTINAQRFGQKFVGKVANPQDLLIWHKAAAKRCVDRDCSPTLSLLMHHDGPDSHFMMAQIHTSYFAHACRVIYSCHSSKPQGASGANDLSEDALRPEALDQQRIQDLVASNLTASLRILHEEDLAGALHDFVEKDDKV